MPQFGGKPKKSSTDSKRHFTVVMGNKEHGLYVSSTPSSAARKAVTKLCAANKNKKVEFHIREITQGSRKKTYGPYEGYIEKLKEPIELKGRVIKYKPVAKLSGKKGAKKVGMMGGAKIIVKEIEYKPKFRIITNADFLKGYKFNPQDLVFNLKKISKEKNLIDYGKRLPEASFDRKYISFAFREDINDKIIDAFLNDQEKKSEILEKLKELRIPHEVKIFFDIPYKFDGESQTRYEEHLYLVYTPTEELAKTATIDPSGQINWNKINKMIHFIFTNSEGNPNVKQIETEEELRQFFGKHKITNKSIQNKLKENYIKEVRKGKKLNNPNSNIYEA